MAVWYFVKRQIMKNVPSDPGDPTSPLVPKPVKADVVFHVDVPGTNNDAGVSWQICAKDDQYNEEVGEVPSSITLLKEKYAARWNKLQSGEYYEVSETVPFSSAYLTDQERQNEIEARGTEIKDTLFAEKSVDWQWYGQTNTIT